MTDLSCPWCDSPADLCDKSDHGTVNGPAMHCRRSPAHNEWNPTDFARWSGSPEGSPVAPGSAGSRTPDD